MTNLTSKEIKKTAFDNAISTLVGAVTAWFIQAWFIKMGFNTVGALWPILNLPVMGYWDAFWLRGGVSTVLSMFKNKAT